MTKRYGLGNAPRITQAITEEHAEVLRSMQHLPNNRQLAALRERFGIGRHEAACILAVWIRDGHR